MSSPTKFDYERSNKKTTVMTEEEMFACDSDLCNGSIINNNNILLTFFIITLPILSSRLFVGGVNL